MSWSPLETMEREVEALVAQLTKQQAALAQAQARRAKAEAETAAARAKMEALKEEEKTLRAAFLQDPFWDKPQVSGRAARVATKPKRFS